MALLARLDHVERLAFRLLVIRELERLAVADDRLANRLGDRADLDAADELVLVRVPSTYAITPLIFKTPRMRNNRTFHNIKIQFNLPVNLR